MNSAKRDWKRSEDILFLEIYLIKKNSCLTISFAFAVNSINIASIVYLRTYFLYQFLKAEFELSEIPNNSHEYLSPSDMFRMGKGLNLVESNK